MATLRIRHADGRGLAHRRMTQQRVLNLHRAHRPAGGDDHVIGTPGMEEIAVIVDPAAVLGRKPSAVPPDFDFADLSRRARAAIRPLHLHPDARYRFAECAWLRYEVIRAGVVG